MNKNEAERFAEDLERGAFKIADAESHQITLDILNQLNDNELTFADTWRNWNNE